MPNETRQETAVTESIQMAILSLLIEEREARPGTDTRMKIELLLANAGLDLATIARLVNKSQEAVRKSVSRAKAREGANTRPETVLSADPARS
jgi:hypothetical protein